MTGMGMKVVYLSVGVWLKKIKWEWKWKLNTVSFPLYNPQGISSTPQSQTS
jgi:hypothetical protein